MTGLDDVFDNYDDCTWCNGDGYTECYDPIQCLDPSCNGRLCKCVACNGRGYNQEVW